MTSSLGKHIRQVRELVSKKQSRTEENTEGEQSRADQQLKQELNVFFIPYKLLEHITSVQRSFCDAAIGFEKVTDSFGTEIYISFSSLFDCSSCKGQVPVINRNLSTSPPRSESELFYDVVANGLQELGRVTLNKDYKQFVCGDEEYLPGDVAGSSGSTNRIACGSIGIGNPKLWWGEPDACVRPLDSDTPLKTNPNSTVVVATNPDPDEETDGESSQFEAEKKKTYAHLPQAVATAIVHSFTQNKRHPGLNPMVPTILINGHVFRIVLYDCCKDVLLVSTPVEYREGSKMTQLGSLVLWITINHRKFLGKFVDDSPYVFGLKEYAEKFDLLDSFKNLEETEVQWKQIKKQFSPEHVGKVIDPPKIEFTPFNKLLAK